MSDKIKVTRKQLARFLPDPEMIKAFENLFKQSTQTTPSNLEEVAIDAGTAISLANSAIELNTSLKKVVDLFETSPQIDTLILENNIDDLYKVLSVIEAKINYSNEYLAQLISRVQKIKTVTASYSAEVGNYSIFADATSGALTVTLPLASSSESFIIGITKIDTSANIVTIDGSGSDTLAGELSHDLILDNEVLNFISDGTNWQLAN